MGNKRWKGGAAAIAQVSTLTVGGTPANGQVYTVTIGYRSIAYAATGIDTNNSIALALQTLLAASTFGEFLEVTWTVNNAVITATANTAGMNFIVTATATGTGTLIVAAVTANSGPNDPSVAINWDAGAVPVASDTVYLGQSNVDLLWNLQVLSGVALGSLTIDSTFQAGSNGNATIGLPEVNTNNPAAPYLEYRQQYLQCSPAICTIGNGNGNGSGRIKLDFGSGQVSLVVHGTGSTIDPNNLPALMVKGSNASNVVNINSGDVGLAQFPEETFTGTVNVASGLNGAPQVYGGVGCAISTLTMNGGTVLLCNGPTTITKTDGALTVLTGNVTTWREEGGGSAYLGSGTITTLTLSDSMDFSQDPSSRTVTNCTINPGGGFGDPQRTVTWTNGFLILDSLSSVNIDWGKNVSAALTYH